MAILSILLTTIIIIASILIILLVLVQRPKQEGLGASFGSSTFDSTLGAGATDFLQKFTAYLGIIFFISAIGLAVVKTRQFGDSPAGNTVEEVKDIQDLIRSSQPPAPTTPVVPPIIQDGTENVGPSTEAPSVVPQTEVPAVEPVTPTEVPVIPTTPEAPVPGDQPNPNGE